MEFKNEVLEDYWGLSEGYDSVENSSKTLQDCGGL